jgi:NAD(P) transhydrogenase subunit alpha
VRAATLISFIRPAQNQPLLDRLAARKGTVLAMDCVPRISRAQKMDALSSMANISGYRAVTEAANQFGSFFTGQITAAGKVPPAKVLIIGAGVAGLASLGAAKGLGAIVRAFDVRAAAGEQIKSSAASSSPSPSPESGEGQGGYAKEMSEGVHRGRDGPVPRPGQGGRHRHHHRAHPRQAGAQAVVHRHAVELMKPGSVIVDLAAEQGGNCELTQSRRGRRATRRDHRRLQRLPSRMPGRVRAVRHQPVAPHRRDGRRQGFKVDHGNDAVRPALVLEGGELRWPPPPCQGRRPSGKPPGAAPAPATPAPAAPAARPSRPWPATRQRATTAPRSRPVEDRRHGHGRHRPHRRGGCGWACASGLKTRDDRSPTAEKLLSQRLTVFVMAMFVGWQVVWNVAPALHTPLMSVTNAISGIIVVGGMLVAIGAPPRRARAGRHRRHPVRHDQHRRRVPGDPPHAGDVPEVGRKSCSPPQRDLATAAYLVAAVLFILSLKRPGSQVTARRGNLYGIVGMAIAIVATLTRSPASMAAPGAAGVIGVGGAVGGGHGGPGRHDPDARAGRAAAQLRRPGRGPGRLLAPPRTAAPASRLDGLRIEIFVDVMIGAITFTGSVLAFLKLRGSVSGKPTLLPARHALNLAC